jgi:hypothetical protein
MPQSGPKLADAVQQPTYLHRSRVFHLISVKNLWQSWIVLKI